MTERGGAVTGDEGKPGGLVRQAVRRGEDLGLNDDKLAF
jgi:hypothetical protein